MPPGTGDIQMTITQSLALSGAVLVTTPHTLAVVDLIKGMSMFNDVKVPALAVV
jgi:ATP-binding protein involved in chromosome partitioning